jgi:hypothetical protein
MVVAPGPALVSAAGGAPSRPSPLRGRGRTATALRPTITDGVILREPPRRPCPRTDVRRRPRDLPRPCWWPASAHFPRPPDTRSRFFGSVRPSVPRQLTRRRSPRMTALGDDAHLRHPASESPSNHTDTSSSGLRWRSGTAASGAG